jgi:nicotinamidase-related amidase
VIDAAQCAVDEAQRNGDLVLKSGNEFRRRDVIGDVFRHHAAMKGTPGAAWDARIDPAGATYRSKWKSDAFCNPDLATLLEAASVGQVRRAGFYANAA